VNILSEDIYNDRGDRNEWATEVVLERAGDHLGIIPPVVCL
jgi:hypothetical protein